LDLFTPETWRAFISHGSTVSGFRQSQRQTALHIRAGDWFACYLVRLSRWVGMLEVVSSVYEDASPIFVPSEDPFIIRFKCRPMVALPVGAGIPINETWASLDMTRGIEPNSVAWAYKVGVARSLKRLSDHDGAWLLERLREQERAPIDFGLSPTEERRLVKSRVVELPAGTAVVEVPDDADEEALEQQVADSVSYATASEAPRHLVSEPRLAQVSEAQVDHRRSLHVQAKLARLGLALGLRVWIPANDKAAVLQILSLPPDCLLSTLPLNADDKTVDTVRQIDVLWIRGRSIVRAFEVEETTAVYSGVLRMADLIALQPQFQIKLHIVAPEARREQVRRQILRPTFAFMEGGPLGKLCTYLPYSAIDDMVQLGNLHLMRHEIVDEYEEFME
jgi:hypothetical protein